MNWRFKRIFKHYLIGWFIASLVWVLLRKLDPSNRGDLSDEVVVFFMLWFLQALFYGFLHIILDSFLNRKVKFITLLASSLFTQLITAFLVLICIHPLLGFFIEDYSFSLRELIGLPTIPASLAYALFVNFFISIMFEVNQILGKSTLKEIVLGKYYSSRVEDRVFMFVDLRGSTTIAEKIGHEDFGRFIQDCFIDLTVVNDYAASVYKYIGDEVILVWNSNDKEAYSNAVESFYAFCTQLKSRKNHYLENYGVEPQFKAGIHSGLVTVAEVGELKREVAFMGDTVNTAARVQGMCNELNTSFLITNVIFDQLSEEESLKFELNGEMILKGKKIPLKLYSLKD